jgi:diguanylate cyclase (GGDEF)-like protein
MSRKAWTYISSVLLTGALLSVLAYTDRPPASALWVSVAVLAVLATLAQLFKVEAPNHVLFYATPVFFFAGVLLLPPRLIVLLIALPHLVEWARERVRRSSHLRAWYLQPFNVAMYTIAALSAHATYTVLAASLAPSVALSALLVVLLAALVYVLLNYLLLGVALLLARGVSVRESGLLDLESQITDLMLLYVGAIVAMLWHVNPWLIALTLSPLVLMYRALSIPQLKQQAQIDAKTGLANARHFGALFAAELERAQRFARPLAVVMADLDRFKAINDTYGHLAGDTVLATVAQIIRTTAREYDIAGRFGGEEFAIVLPEGGRAEAQAFAEHLRLAVEAARVAVPTSATPLSVTLSLGVACFPEHGDTPTELTQEADAALYQAKAGGRNRVACAAMPGSTSVEPGMAVGLPATLPAPASTPEPAPS